MCTPLREINHVHVQRGRVVGQFDDLGGAWMRGRIVEEFDECHACEHPTPTARTGRRGRRLESVGEGEERRSLDRVELEPTAGVVEDGEHGSGHGPGPYGRHRLGCPSCAVSWPPAMEP